MTLKKSSPAALLMAGKSFAIAAVAAVILLAVTLPVAGRASDRGAPQSPAPPLDVVHARTA